MALHLTNPEADRLAREMAKLTGETLADVVKNAVRSRLERLRMTGEIAKPLETSPKM